MTETKKILNIALPAMAENLLQMLMGIVDSYLVAQVGIVAISGFPWPIISLRFIRLSSLRWGLQVLVSLLEA